MRPLLLVGKENASTLLTKYYGDAETENSIRHDRVEKMFNEIEQVPDYSIILIYDDDSGEPRAVVKDITEKFDRLIKTSFSSNTSAFINNLLEVGKIVDPENSTIYDLFKVKE